MGTLLALYGRGLDLLFSFVTSCLRGLNGIDESGGTRTGTGFGLGRRQVAVRHIMEQVHDVDFSSFRMRLTFAGFLIAYGFMRQVAPAWPVQMEVFSPLLITFMTFVLISSSAVMAMAVSAARAGNPKDATKFLCLNDFRRSDLPGLSGLRMVAFHFRRRDPDAKSMGSPAVCGRVLCYHRVSTVSTCSAG